jgi:hypothetical protein
VNFKEYYLRFTDFSEYLDNTLNDIESSLRLEVFLRYILLCSIITLSALGSIDRLSSVAVGGSVLVFAFVLIFLEFRGNIGKLIYRRLLVDEHKSIILEHKFTMEHRLEKGYRYTSVEIVDGINAIQKIESSLKVRLLIV